MSYPALIEITIKITGGTEQTVDFIEKLARVLKGDIQVATAVVDTSNVATTTAPAKKARTGKRASKDKPDPFELVKKGWVVRGPYPHSSSNYKQVIVTNPAAIYKEKVCYSLGLQITEEQFEKLRELTTHNEDNFIDRRKNKKKKPSAAIRGCTICMKPDVATGVCATFYGQHCADCCTRLNHRVD